MDYHLIVWMYCRNAMFMRIGARSLTVAVMDAAATKDCVIVRRAGLETAVNW